MSSELFFSVVIPTYNRAEYILETVHSVLDQTYPHFEVIVIDDGSTDRTPELIATISDPRLIYIQKKNEERSIARNTGIVIAKGDYVTFLDSDDLFLPQHLATAARKLAEYGNPAFFHSAYEIRNASSGKVTTVNCPTDLNSGLIDGNFLSCHGMFVNRQTMLENQFNPALSFMEDWELWLRIAALHRLHFSAEVTSVLMDHDARSVSDAHPEKIVAKVLLFLETALANDKITGYYAGKTGRLKSSCYSYIALHVALTGNRKKTTLRYLLRGVVSNPWSLFSRRTLAIVKHVIKTN